jgi:hypothetical protein
LAAGRHYEEKKIFVAGMEMEGEMGPMNVYIMFSRHVLFF